MKIDVLYKDTITDKKNIKNTVIFLKVTTSSLEVYRELFTIKELPDELVDPLVNRKFTYYYLDLIAYSNRKYSYEELVESIYDPNYDDDINWIRIIE